MVSCSGIQTRYHCVKDGETLSAIATQYEVPLSALRAANEASSRKSLVAGTKLYIPFEESPNWDMESDDDNSVSEPVRSASSSSLEDFGKVTFDWPVSGRVSSYFGMRRFLGGSRTRKHQGIDIAAPSKTPVRAARSGHVIYAGNRIPGYGNLVILRHPDSFSTVYAHLSKIKVRKGQFVSRTQLVGLVGKTGRATSYHLHFEVRNGTRPVNPLLYLRRFLARNP